MTATATATATEQNAPRTTERPQNHHEKNRELTAALEGFADRQGFYRKAYVAGTSNLFELYSYDTRVATCSIVEVDRTPKNQWYYQIDLTFYDIDETATPTTRRHMRAFATLCDVVCQAKAEHNGGKLPEVVKSVQVTTFRKFCDILPHKTRTTNRYNRRSKYSDSYCADCTAQLLKEYPTPSTQKKREEAEKRASRSTEIRRY